MLSPLVVALSRTFFFKYLEIVCNMGFDPHWNFPTENEPTQVTPIF